MAFPQLSQTSPLGSAALFSFGSDLVFLHSGYPEQAKNFPRRPMRMTIALPHNSHFSPVSSGFTMLPALSMEILYVQAGYVEQAKNFPKRLSRTTIMFCSPAFA